MAAEKVVRAYFDAWNRRDLVALEATLAQEVEWRRSADFPEGRTLKGRDSLLDFARSMFDVFTETPIEVDELTEGRGGSVVAVGTSRFVGGRSGVTTHSTWARIYAVENGLIVAVRPYPTREQALRAAG